MDFREDRPEIDALLEEADEAFDKGEFDMAVRRYSDVLRIDFEHVGALMNRGAAYHSLGQYEKALEDDLRALEYDTEDE